MTSPEDLEDFQSVLDMALEWEKTPDEWNAFGELLTQTLNKMPDLTDRRAVGGVYGKFLTQGPRRGQRSNPEDVAMPTELVERTQRLRALLQPADA